MEIEPLEQDWYYTLRKPGEGLYKDRGSKFYGYAFPAARAQEAMQQLESLQKEHHSARHHCYAYRCRPLNPEVRLNDDGEPGHSAGTPIFSEIKAQELWDVMIVVVRYFGGTKLGVPGLIKAYRSAAAEALAHTETKVTVIRREMEISFPYARTGDIMQLLEKQKVPIVENKMTQVATLAIKPRISGIEPLRAELAKLPDVILE